MTVPGRMTRVMCSAVLAFEAVLMLLSILVLNGFSSLPVPAAAGIGVGLAVACIAAAGSLGRSWGYGVGHALQVGILAVGLVAVPILVMGVVFVALWIVAYVLGMRIDHDRAVR